MSYFNIFFHEPLGDISVCIRNSPIEYPAADSIKRPYPNLASHITGDVCRLCRFARDTRMSPIITVSAVAFTPCRQPRDEIYAKTLLLPIQKCSSMLSYTAVLTD